MFQIPLHLSPLFWRMGIGTVAASQGLREDSGCLTDGKYLAHCWGKRKNLECAGGDGGFHNSPVGLLDVQPTQ